jgi:hypothetical protein
MAQLRKSLRISAPSFMVRRQATRTKRPGNNVCEVAVATFDPSANAAQRTIATHGLGVFLPANAVITRSWYDVVTTFTSATDAATIALQAETANDVKAAIAISNGANAWDAGRVEGVSTGTTANMRKTTTERQLSAVVANEALTAGKLNLYVEYVISD